MTENEILRELLAIYKKYFKAVQSMGTLKMSTKDAERVEELESMLPDGATVYSKEGS